MTTSLSSRDSYRPSDGQPGSVVWFLSFGDLLTLLLCFFLVLTPWDRLNQVKNAQSLQGSSAQNPIISQSGTTFASDHPLRGSVLSREIPILAREVSADDALMFGDLRRDLEARPMPVGRVEVLVCSPSDERARIVRGIGAALKQSVEREVSVRFVVNVGCDDRDVLVPVTEPYIGRIRVFGA